MTPRQGSLPFCRVESAQLLDPNKHGKFLVKKVCGESAAKYFSRNKLPARFPDDVVRVKRSTLRTVDGAAFEGKASSELRRHRGFVVCDISSAFTRFWLFKENAFERLRDN